MLLDVKFETSEAIGVLTEPLKRLAQRCASDAAFMQALLTEPELTLSQHEIVLSPKELATLKTYISILTNSVELWNPFSIQPDERGGGGWGSGAPGPQ